MMEKTATQEKLLKEIDRKIAEIAG